MSGVDTCQTICYSDSQEIACPQQPGQSYYGQDAQYDGALPAYQDNGDGTITDLNTGLMWQKTPDLENKRTWQDVISEAETFQLAGHQSGGSRQYKELYSLIDFSGDTLDWEEALQYAEELVHAGYDD